MLIQWPGSWCRQLFCLPLIPNQYSLNHVLGRILLQLDDKLSTVRPESLGNVCHVFILALLELYLYACGWITREGFCTRAQHVWWGLSPFWWHAIMCKQAVIIGWHANTDTDIIKTLESFCAITYWICRTWLHCDVMMLCVNNQLSWATTNPQHGFIWIR